jgi:hypothetical protein
MQRPKLVKIMSLRHLLDLAARRLWGAWNYLVHMLNGWQGQGVGAQGPGSRRRIWLGTSLTDTGKPPFSQRYSSTQLHLNNNIRKCSYREMLVEQPVSGNF